MSRLFCMIAILYLSTLSMHAQIQTPAEKKQFTSVSSNEEIVAFLQALHKVHPVFTIDTATTTVSGRKIPVVTFGAAAGKANQLKVLFFAQQHGDEPSGKEGMLMLIRDLAEGKMPEMLKSLHITIIPQVNPDGGAVCRRRNGNMMDLNRNHLILTETETNLIHKIYHEQQPELTIDFHEYSPYSESWEKYGAIKKFDEQVGTLTNPLIPSIMKTYQKEQVLPVISKALTDKGFTYHEYLVGGPPEVERLRFSTTHANDGRQGLGFFGSFSFIVEGKNGRDCVDNLAYRAKGQYTAAVAFLSYTAAHKNEIRDLVKRTREELAAPAYGKTISTVNEHVGNGSRLQVTLQSVSTGKDTTVTVKEFHPVVKSLKQCSLPLGYLVPKSDTKLTELLKRHHMPVEAYQQSSNERVMQYAVKNIDSLTVEEDPFLQPVCELQAVNIKVDDYWFVPLNGKHQYYAALAMEPVSLYGLHQFEAFSYLLKANSMYPILRVEKK